MTRTPEIGTQSRARLHATGLGCAPRIQMNIKNLAIIMSAVPIGAIGVGQAAVAQETSGSAFEEIIVTAQRREQSIYDVPVAISAFSPETMERQGITDLVDIGKFVPNLNVTGFSAGHTSSANPFIRGIGLQDHLITTEPGVGVYVDGIYLGRQVGQNWNLTNIERVEVLRGPQGTLYGRNSIGGAINIITRKPGDEEGGRVSLMAGSRGRLNGDAYTNLRLSDQVAMSFTAAYQSRDGLGDFRLIEEPNKEVGEMQDISGRVAVQWAPTDRLSFLVTADGNDGENGLRPYDTLIDELGAGCRATAADPATCPTNGAVYNAGYRNSDTASDPYDNNTGQADQIEVTNQAYGVSLTVDYEVSDALNFKLLASDRHSEYESGLDDDSFFDDFLSFPEVGEADQQSVELQVLGKSGAFDYVLGFYWFQEEGHNFQNDTTFNCGTKVFDPLDPLGSRGRARAPTAATSSWNRTPTAKQSSAMSDSTLRINCGLRPGSDTRRTTSRRTRYCSRRSRSPIAATGRRRAGMCRPHTSSVTG